MRLPYWSLTTTLQGSLFYANKGVWIRVTGPWSPLVQVQRTNCSARCLSNICVEGGLKYLFEANNAFIC